MPRLASFLILTALTLSAAGQTGARHAAEPGALPLVAAHVEGSKRFTEADVLAEVGLKIGSAVSADDLKTAAEHLSDSGAFKNVGYKYSFSSKGMTADFTVADADQFLPVLFDNFVWLPPKQLLDKLHDEVPLFKGELPPRGTLPDEVSTALRKILGQAGSEGAVNYQLSGSVKEPNKEITFTVEDVRIDVRSVRFPGASPEIAPLLESAAKPLVGTYYSSARIAAAARLDLLPVYRHRGWLRASLAPPVPHVTQSSPDVAEVDVDLPAEPGLLYRVKDFTFTGFTILPAAQARKLMHMAPGQPADEVQFDKDLDAIRNFYGSRGYIKANVSATPEFDDSSATVIFALQATEGDQYRMGTFEVEGVEKSTTARLTEAWKLRAGEPYDKTYLKRYLTTAGSVFPRLDQLRVNEDETIDESTKTVDVLLRFTPK